MSLVLFAQTPTAPRQEPNDCVQASNCTSDGLLVMLDGTSPLHLHHTPLDAAVVDVAEVLGVLLHALCHQVGGGGSEAALALLKVLVVSHLESTDRTESVTRFYTSKLLCLL